MGVKIGGVNYVIPQRMLDSISRYVNHGIPVGHFLEAFIQNNLLEAISRADDENLKLFPAYANLFYWEAPSGCIGSEQAYIDWVATGGLRGKGFKEVSFVHFSDNNKSE
jgi:hypothetical protein